ncbi:MULTISPECIES: hypothetical protein [unclassified Streptomyces]|uniref:hypothetical protein n=1 Tax=Streptomyces sp. SID4950 TaxID=2690288 RepID=UPI00081B76BF|nr:MULTISPECIES: hypothetical protein [unclassified Streptomyces]SCE04284.1 hypothetical protein GA0115242_120515 [Streptomyces sp. SolWspMP-5a-2]
MTNGLLLYGRSRGVPAAAGVLLVTAALLGVFGPRAGAADPRLLALAAAAGVTAASAGLAGQDPDLDRTAALSWPPGGRRTSCCSPPPSPSSSRWRGWRSGRRRRSCCARAPG